MENETTKLEELPDEELNNVEGGSGTKVINKGPIRITTSNSRYDILVIGGVLRGRPITQGGLNVADWQTFSTNKVTVIRKPGGPKRNL